MKRYVRKFEEANLKSLDYYINFYENGLRQVKKLETLIDKLKKQFDISKVNLPNGWMLADIYFNVDNDKDNEFTANAIYSFLKKLNIPTFSEKWRHGDGNKVIIELNKIIENKYEINEINPTKSGINSSLIVSKKQAYSTAVFDISF